MNKLQNVELAPVIKKPQPAQVILNRDDVAYMRTWRYGFTPQEIKSGAKARAAGREFFMSCRSTELALTAFLSGVPLDTKIQALVANLKALGFNINDN